MRTAHYHKLKVGRVLNATSITHGNNELDLHVGIWVNREVLENFAPSLLDSRCFDDIWSMGKLIQVKGDITALPVTGITTYTLRSFLEP